MQLLPDELRAIIPALYSQENIKTQEKTVHAKFFFPAVDWTWFVIEGKQEEDDFVFFGFVIGFVEEWGYFTLNELEHISIEGLTVERDLHFKPSKFCDVIAQFRKECRMF
ncbi:MAG: DUF2958 domain-containing protein [Pyrinomonadaceae bacterium]